MRRSCVGSWYALTHGCARAHVCDQWMQASWSKRWRRAPSVSRHYRDNEDEQTALYDITA